jgi:hypothetical protein
LGDIKAFLSILLLKPDECDGRIQLYESWRTGSTPVLGTMDIILYIVASVFILVFLCKQKPVNETISGRWGYKFGKFISGDFGGDKWNGKK